MLLVQKPFVCYHSLLARVLNKHTLNAVFFKMKHSISHIKIATTHAEQGNILYIIKLKVPISACQHIYIFLLRIFFFIDLPKTF